ncbi:MAG: hypothetical protein NTW29_07620 [Bacteroidetes bacterium]|nr:hypothetical protein [Bacteroidota bacterium]
MKKIIVTISFSLILLACGTSKSGTDLGKEVCDCTKKANLMDPSDPNRSKAQADCGKMQVEAWDKVKDDQKKADEFNKVLSVCATEQIKESFGK